MEQIRDLLDQAIETLATQTNTVISASTRAVIEFDFGFETFGEKKLCEMLAASQDFIREMATGKVPTIQRKVPEEALAGFRGWEGAAPARRTWRARYPDSLIRSHRPMWILQRAPA